MNGMDKIKAKIEEAAKAELTAIENETKEKVDSIKAQGEAEAKQVAEDILSRGKVQAAERGQRLTSSAQMECRKLELAMKQDVISEAFDKALEDLCSRSEKEYQTLLVSLALGCITSGNETLIFSPKDKDTVGKQVVAKINESIGKGKAPELPASITDSKAGPFLEKMVKAVNALVNTGNVSLSSETRPIAGGFIMLDGDVEINCDFDTLVRLQRNELELEVSNMIF